MSKQLTIKVTDKQYDYFKRIAIEDNRKLNDLVRLIFCTGCHFHWAESHFSIKKRDDEYTPEEQNQIVKNEKIRKELEKKGRWIYQLSNEEEVELGYKTVSEWFEGGGYGSDNNFVDVLTKGLKEVLVDQEEN
jgi:hypothetical protein|tara:strand:+ start:284 stop:682 length:399 start_codon:yes stop_codon:yes gene_type:complete